MKKLRRNLRTILVVVLLVVVTVLLLTGCGDYYSRPTAVKMDEGHPPNCYALTDDGLTKDPLGVYCRTTTTAAPR